MSLSCEKCKGLFKEIYFLSLWSRETPCLLRIADLLMLKLLHRHVLKEILVSTGLAMGLFIFVLLMGNVIKDVAELVVAGKLDLVVFLKLVGSLIPYVASYALPLGMLTGTLIALGRLSSQQEITAMKASGVSLYQIASPVFLISFFAMIASVIVTLHLSPKSRVANKEMMQKLATENPLGFIEAKRFIHEFPGYVIYLGGRDGSVMQDFWIWELDDAGEVEVFLRAAEGTVDLDESTNELILTLKNGTAEQRKNELGLAQSADQVRSLFFGELPIALPLNPIFGEIGKQRRLRTKEMTFAQLMVVRDRELLKEAESGSGMTPERLEVQLHLQKNCAMAFSVFSLAVFGVPLAIQVGRKETYANMGIALAVALIYYFLIVALSWLEEVPALRPDLLIWLPNILFQSIGFWLIHRANQH